MINHLFTLKSILLLSVMSMFIISCGSYNHTVYESDGVYYDPSAQVNGGYFDYEVDADNSNDNQRYLSNIQLNNGASQWGVNEGTEVNYINNNYYGNNWGWGGSYWGNPYWNMRPYMAFNPYWGWNSFRPGFSFNIGWNSGFYNNYWLGMGYYPPMYGYYGNPYYNGFYNGYYPGNYYSHFDTYGRRKSNLSRVNNNSMGRKAARNVNQEVVSSRSNQLVSTVPVRNSSIRTNDAVQANPRTTSPSAVNPNNRISSSRPVRANDANVGASTSSRNSTIDRSRSRVRPNSNSSSNSRMRSSTPSSSTINRRAPRSSTRINRSSNSRPSSSNIQRSAPSRNSSSPSRSGSSGSRMGSSRR